MSKQLRVLIVEDSEDDTLLLLRELRKGGYEPVYERVETAESMKAALKKQKWDIIISDYVMPRFFGLAALNVLKESGLDLPFIIVSGNIGEDIAVGAMRAGAHDYIIKGNLKRLIPAVERELREAEVRYERKKIANGLKYGNTLLRLLNTISSRKEYLDEVIRLASIWSGCRCAGIRILGENGSIPYESYTGFSREFWESENCLSVKKDQCICIRVITGNAEPQDVPAMTQFGTFCCDNTFKFMSGLSAQERKRFRDVCVQNGFASLAVIPIRYKEKVIAALHFADEREGVVSQEFIELFETIMPLIGEAIHKLDAEAENARLAGAVESSPDAVAITGTDWIVRYVNPAFENTTGYDRDEIVGRSLHILKSNKHDETYYDEIWNTVKQGSVWNGRLTSRRKDGTVYEEDVTFAPIKDNSGNVQNYVAIKRDVTEKLRLESIAEAVNTMDNIGYVFAGIRHEIGNPVNSTKMTLNVLKRNVDKLQKTDVMDYIERAIGELSRIEYLLKNLKSFNMFERPEPQNVEITSFMSKFMLLIRGDFCLRRKIDVTASINPAADCLYADSRALQQVLLNILTNAADALEGRENPKIEITVSKLSDMILMRVEDNGCGMTEEQLADIFKPFCTTKKHGTGLGLVIVKKMLSYMNGFIEVTSMKNVGTTIEIFIPAGKNEG